MAVVATIAVDSWFLSFLLIFFFVKLKSIDQTVIDLWCMTNKINGRLNDLLRRRLCVVRSFARSLADSLCVVVFFPPVLFVYLGLMFVSNQFICKQILSWANIMYDCELQTDGGFGNVCVIFSAAPRPLRKKKTSEESENEEANKCLGHILFFVVVVVVFFSICVHCSKFAFSTFQFNSLTYCTYVFLHGMINVTIFIWFCDNSHGYVAWLILLFVVLF